MLGLRTCGTAAALLLCLLGTGGTLHAQTHHEHPATAGAQLGDFGYRHEDYHWWYSTGEPGRPGIPIMRPHQPGVPCCGVDCRPTKARQTPQGTWEVWVDREWLPVPESRIRDLRPPQDKESGLAHVCALAKRNWVSGQSPIFCFFPPGLEM